MTKKSTAPKRVSTPPIPLAIGGVSYEFKLGVNELCDLEEKVDTSLGYIIEGLQKGVDIRVIRAALFVSLTRPDGVEVTEVEAGTVLAAIGLAEAAAMVAAGLKECMGG